MSNEEETIKAFMSLGLSEQKAKETLKNAAITKNLLSILNEVRGVKVSETMGILLYQLGTKIKPQIIHHMPLLVKYIMTNKLDSTLRVDKAIEFALSHIKDIKSEELEVYCGVGIIVTPEEIEKVVEKQINVHKNELLVKRYRFNAGPLMQKVRSELPWADGKAIKNEVDLQIFYSLGPKTEADLAPVSKTDKKAVKPMKAESKPSAQKIVNAEDQTQGLTILDVMKKVNFHAPGENFKTDGYIVTDNTHQLLKEHLKITGGKVRTRFPPEPNGILHIGHAKAININFGYAAATDGLCFLRYDDTNPEKEEEKFFTGIKDMVTWLGYKPYKITHSSDYFDQLYEWAVQLIKEGLAYVCHQTAEQMKGFNPEPSPWRNRPIDESLQLFEDMKNGKIDEGAATLRMKITLEEGKLDPVAYRVRFVPHHRTGDKWCIYPTYDFTHCLCDSIENITHSLCTKEFQSRRSSYYWLCNALNLYCPVQWEYGRLNVNYTVVSKRKIAKLIDEGIVKDWDDPRLFTLTALRRRGFPSEAINNFCAQLGVTGAQSTVDPSMLEAFVRDHLNNTAPRRMVVLEPLKVVIENFSQAEPMKIDVPNFPSKPLMGNHTVILDKVIYIEKTDFMEVGEKGYRRLTKSQSVGLRHSGYILEVTNVIKTGSEVTEIICKWTEVDKAPKPKAFIHWVSNPMEVEVRLYSSLFKHKNPEDPNEVPGGFVTDCNKDSLNILRSFADKSLKNCKVYDKYQFERIGFFSIDPDTCDKKIVVNQTVGLKEDAGKYMSDNEMDIVEENDSGEEEEMDESRDNNTTAEDSKVYLPGKPLEEGEELVCDQTAYVMYHQAQTSAPCLSFDIIKDNLGDNRETFPLSTYIVAGTQASKAHVNNIIVMKLSNLHRTSKDDDEDDDSDEEDEDENKNPKMAGALIKHQGCVNRIRSTTVNNNVLAATWSELGRVNIWNLNKQLRVVEEDQLLAKYNKENTGNTQTPLFTFSGHQKEGFAIDWCSTIPGVLATGDCRCDIHVWKPTEAGTWSVDQRPLVGHTDSVEDIQWSPNERNVMASCSVDKSIRIWDTRAPPNKACMLTAEKAHDSDVNVINWNKNEPFIVSGGDDGFLHIWDLRKFQDKVPLATFKHHTESVVTVEWHPTDSAVFASGGSDNQISLWDLSVEKDSEGDSDDVQEIPPQLLFIHQGQRNIKELHWHPQLPGVIISTAESGFNIFRTISV